MADAWDVQMSIEEVATNAPLLAGALLDYEKLFDLFQPDFVRGMLEVVGTPKGISQQRHHLCTHLQRYIRVVGTYGGVICQTNGVG